MAAIFDASDVDYLVRNLSEHQLRQELYKHDVQFAFDINRDYPGWADPFWLDYGKAVELALAIRSYKPKREIKNPAYRESIESIKARYDLAQYIGQSIKLRKSGNRFTGLCPFHSDRKTPSLVVYPSQDWHCFGCGAGGSVIDFVMKIENISVKEAIGRLAK